MFVTGRAPNSKRLNLKAVGVEVDKHGAVKVIIYLAFSIIAFCFQRPLVFWYKGSRVYRSY